MARVLTLFLLLLSLNHLFALSIPIWVIGLLALVPSVMVLWSTALSAWAENNMEKQNANAASNRREGEAVRTVTRCSGVLLSMFTLAGCATNPVAESYRDRPAGVESARVVGSLAPYSGTTTLQPSTDLESDGANLTRDGYVQIGASFYEGREPVTRAQIVTQGERVQADLVLYQNGRGISRAAVAITAWNPVPSRINPARRIPASMATVRQPLPPSTNGTRCRIGPGPFRRAW